MSAWRMSCATCCLAVFAILFLFAEGMEVYLTAPCARDHYLCKTGRRHLTQEDIVSTVSNQLGQNKPEPTATLSSEPVKDTDPDVVTLTLIEEGDDTLPVGPPPSLPQSTSVNNEQTLSTTQLTPNDDGVSLLDIIEDHADSPESEEDMDFDFPEQVYLGLEGFPPLSSEPEAGAPPGGTQGYLNPASPGANIQGGVPGGNIQGGVPGGNVQGGVPGGNIQGGIPGGNIQGGIPGGNVQGGIPGGNVQGGIPGGNIQGSIPGGNIQGGIPGGNIQGGIPGGNIQGGIPGGNIQGGIPGGNIEGGIPGGNIQGGIPGGNIQGGIPGGNIQGGIPGGNIQGGIQGGNVQGGIQGGNVQGGIQGGIQRGPIYVGQIPPSGPPTTTGGPVNLGTLPSGSVSSIGPEQIEARKLNLTAEIIEAPPEGKDAEFYGQVNADLCPCTDAVPSNAFNCMQVRFQGECELDSILKGPPDVPEGFCQITCGRCKCCTDMLTMSSRRGLDTFRRLFQTMADAQGSRSIGRSLQNPSFETTVFAPTNGAFARMLYVLNMTVDEFLMQPSLMNQVMTYHVLLGPTAASEEELATGFLGTTLPTVNAAAFVSVNASGPVLSVGGIGSFANVIVPNVYSCKSIFHIIDEVLLPFSPEGLQG